MYNTHPTARHGSVTGGCVLSSLDGGAEEACLGPGRRGEEGAATHVCEYNRQCSETVGGSAVGSGRQYSSNSRKYVHLQ